MPDRLLSITARTRVRHVIVAGRLTRKRYEGSPMAMQDLLNVARREESTLPLKGYIRLYDAQLRTERKAAKTIEVCSYVLGKFEQWFAGEYGRSALLADFRSEQARSFMVAVQDKPKWEGHPTLEGVTTAGISGATLHLYVRTLKTFSAWLAREGCVPANPVETLRLPRVDQKQLQPLTEEEERRLIGAYDDNNPVDCRVKAIFLLMLDTGIRRGEVITLKDGNVDLEHSFLLVMGTGRKERSVPFGYTTEKVLRKYATFFRPDPAAPTVEEFFLSSDGYPLTSNALVMIFARARKRAGITRLHSHLLRHTYGIRAQEGDMPTITPQHSMGHPSSKVTERYVHAAQSERLKRARGYSPIDQLGFRVKQLNRRTDNRRRR